MRFKRTPYISMEQVADSMSQSTTGTKLDTDHFQKAKRKTLIIRMHKCRQTKCRNQKNKFKVFKKNFLQYLLPIEIIMLPINLKLILFF